MIQRIRRWIDGRPLHEKAYVWGFAVGFVAATFIGSRHSHKSD